MLTLLSFGPIIITALFIAFVGLLVFSDRAEDKKSKTSKPRKSQKHTHKHKTA